MTNNIATLGFRIYMDDGSGQGEVEVWDSTDSSYALYATITGLTTGTSYTTTVRAVNAIGESADSASVAVNAGTVPSKISNVFLSASTATSVTVGWDAPSSNGGLTITQYNIYYDVGQTGSFSTHTETDNSVFTYQLTGQTTGVLVDYQISASNVNGEGELSNLKTLYVATAPATPSAPTSGGVFQTDYASETVSIVVEWTEPTTNGADISGYKLYSAQGASGYTLIYDGTRRSDLLSYTSTGLNRGESYHFKVLAINDVGESSLSPSVTILAAIVPDVPGDFIVSDSGSGTIDISWSSPAYDGGASLTGYYAYHRLSSASSWAKSSLIDYADSAYTFSALTANAQYVVKLTAANSEGESDDTDAIY